MRFARFGLALALCAVLTGSASADSVVRRRIGSAGAWKNTQAAAFVNGQIYTVEGGGLYRTDPHTGAWTQVGAAEFADTLYMFPLGDYLYTIESDGSLYLVGPGNGAWRQVGETGDWTDTIAGTSLVFNDQTGVLLTAESNGGLYITWPIDGSWKQVGQADFGNTRFMFVAGAWLYTIETDGSLYQVQPTDGAWRRVGKAGAWVGTVSGAVYHNRLYTADEDGGLYETDLSSGEYRRLAATGFDDADYMLAGDDAIYTIHVDGSLYRLESAPSQSASLPQPMPQAPRPAQSTPQLPPQLPPSEAPSSPEVKTLPAVPSSTWYSLERTPARRIRAVNQGRFTIADVVPSRWMIATSLAPDLPSQSGVSTSMVPKGKVVREAGDGDRLLLIAEYPSSEQEQTVTITYEATLWRRQLVSSPNYGSSPVPPLAETDRERFLRSDVTLDFQTPAFQQWLERNQLRRGADEDAVAFGRRVFAVMLKQYRTRDKSVIIKSKPASEYCTWDIADCKVRAVVFAAAMRSAGIPTRQLCGMLAESDTPNERGEVEGHTRPEFFVDGVGWVPVEFNYALTDPHHAQAHFGEDAGDMFVEHVGTHVKVPRPGGGAMTPYGLDRPAGSVSGKQSGNLAYRTLAWDVTTIPMSVSQAAAIQSPPVGPIASPEEAFSRPPTPSQSTTTGGHVPPAGSRPPPQNPVPAGSPLSGSSNIKPLGGDRYQLDMTYQDTSGETRSRQFAGTKDELHAALQAADMPAGARNSGLMLVDRIGQVRQAPAHRTPLVPRQGGQ